MMDLSSKIKEILASHEAYTVKQLSEMTESPTTTVKRTLRAMAPAVKSAKLLTGMKGCPYSYWLSPSKYDDYDEPMTKMDVVKELLREGEELSYLTFGNKQDGDSTVYMYVRRLQAVGWNIEKVKNGTGRSVFRLISEPGPDYCKPKRGQKATETQNRQVNG